MGLGARDSGLGAGGWRPRTGDGGCSLRAGVLEAVIAHARVAAPAECCGILLGRAAEIVEAIPTRNLSDDPNRFLIDPKDHFDARRLARRRGLDVVGFYHSHPHSAPTPSAVDLAEASYPDHLYLIVGLQAEAAARVYRLENGEFHELLLTS